ncbi:ribonuclease P protein component [Mycobacterium shimoidei]|uniref:ribonuclease P protein component n=1 Tax=Mycobacterium shimoidei TaxID=29313 RepID=UPI000A0708AC|nr:ribonuclease P protein component [Mycobacterium shimoidei]MCV7258790.1 ribonuclease P protein component [Mycobacterium shimoidei]
MLSARNRMTRSAEFDAAVKHGIRAVQPDLVLHARRAERGSPVKVGLIITKSVGSAVQRHRVARRLRHVAREVVKDLENAGSSAHVVIRALPSSRDATSARLERQLRCGLRRACQVAGARQ